MDTDKYTAADLRRTCAALFGIADEPDKEVAEDSGPWLIRPIDLAKHFAACREEVEAKYSDEQSVGGNPEQDRKDWEASQERAKDAGL